MTLQWLELVLFVIAGSAATMIALRWAGALFLAWSGNGPPKGSAPEIIAQAFRELSRRPVLSVVSVGLLTLALRAAMLPLLGVPVPAIHDEFSYLLAADTFAHGRMTNPTPPHWMHFESVHIIVRPTYMSMYPVGQGLTLALGEVLGHPWIGVWLSVAVMCAGICWMLQGWMPLRWALLGGIFATLTIGLFNYWIDSYWGGAVAATGGCLVLGALPRIQKRQRVRDAVLFALGLAVLANSRPFEGLVFGGASTVALLIWMLGKKGPPSQVSIPRIVLPIAGVMAVTFAAMGYYFWRGTGCPWHMPYQVARETYAITPVMLWQSIRTHAPTFHNQLMRIFYLEWEPHMFLTNRSDLVAFTARKALVNWYFYLGPCLTLPLLYLGWVFKDRRVRIPLLVFAATALALGLEGWIQPHYAAPLTCALYAIVMQGFRHMRVWKWNGRRVGLLLARTIIVGCVALVFLRLGAVVLHMPVPDLWPRGDPDRAALKRRLEETPGSHLVFVRYLPGHNPQREWVYNGAEIDGAKVLWVREIDLQSDQELIRYFKYRRVWLVQPDVKPVKLTAYGSGITVPTAPPQDGGGNLVKGVEISASRGAGAAGSPHRLTP